MACVTASLAPLHTMDLLVSRQPILDRHMALIGYEMSFPPGRIEWRQDDPIRGGKPCFIPLSAESLLDGVAEALPAREAVLLLSAAATSPEIVDTCRRLQNRGYRIALDNFEDSETPNPLVRFVDFLRVDVPALALRQQQAIVWKYSIVATLIANRVESRRDFEQAASLGFRAFQGSFIFEPVFSPTRSMQPRRVSLLRILEHLWRPHLSLDHLTDLLQYEARLSLELLRCVHSAARRVDPARVHVSEEGLRRWYTILALVELAADQPRELMASALIRARFGELLAAESGMEGLSEGLFLTGIFSHLDAVCGKPLDEVLSGLAIDRRVRRVLLRQAEAGDPLDQWWSIVRAYQAGRFDELAGLPESLRLGLPGLYREAVRWADEVLDERR